MSLKQPQLFERGFHLQAFPVRKGLADLVREEKWAEVYAEFTQLTTGDGSIIQLLREYHDFSDIELMIAIRDSSNEFEEDGIWHDDGSRVFAFSLSLTFEPETIEGGWVELRRKDTLDSELIATPAFGTAILFLTGVHGYEHRTRRVTRGKRVILVGWCSR